jgi:pimeloyl-ACP methyl ester carboxylesterase
MTDMTAADAPGASPAFTRRGAGRPLLLLHALGASRRSWDPVLPALAERFDVLAVDLPGFGASAPLPTEPTPARLASAVGKLLDDLGIAEPHVAGNSLGGWVALELAAQRPVASLTLFAPAGLWRRGTPRYCRVSLRTAKWLVDHAGGLLSALMRSRGARILVLGQTHGRPARLTAEQARRAIADLRRCPGFASAYAATLPRRYDPPAPLDVPTSVAYGTRDRILLRRQSRDITRLPPRTRVHSLPGCGHLPMADDPDAVTAVITGTAASARPSRDRRIVRRSAAPPLVPEGGG